MITWLLIGFVIGCVAAVLLIMWIARWHLKTQAAAHAKKSQAAKELDPTKGFDPIDLHWIKRHGTA